jgi:L-ribulose-5-phosphate 4-epimerase
MYEKEKDEIIKTAKKLMACGIIKLTTGNLSRRSDINKDHIIFTPSGMDYNECGTVDMVVLDIDGNSIEGEREPSKEKDGCLYIYKKIPEVNAIIHTHQVYATAAGLITDVLPAILTTQASAVGGEVKVAPYAPAGSIETGIYTVENLGDKNAVILKHHGVNVVGKNLNEALHAAIYLEEAAEAYLALKPIGEPPVLLDWQIKKAHEIYEGYLKNK